MPAISPAAAPCLSGELLLHVQIGWSDEIVSPLCPMSFAISVALHGPNLQGRPQAHPESTSKARLMPHLPVTLLSLGRKPVSQAVQDHRSLWWVTGVDSLGRGSLQNTPVPHPDMDTASAWFLFGWVPFQAYSQLVGNTR